MLTRTMLRFKVAIHAAYDILLQPALLVLQVVVFIAIILLLQWLFQISVFTEIVTNQALSLSDKLDTLSDAFFSVFSLSNDLTPISFISIALFQSSSIALLVAIRSLRVKRNQKYATSLGLGLVGSGCVACGGSIFTPLLGLVATEISITFAEAIGDFILLGAVALAVKSWLDIANVYAREVRL